MVCLRFVEKLDGQKSDTGEDHQCDSGVRPEHGLDLFVKKQPDDTGGDECRYEFDPECTAVYQALAVDEHDRKDRCDLDNDLVGGEEAILFQSQKLSGQIEVRGGRDRQIFGDALDDTENDRVE